MRHPSGLDMQLLRLKFQTKLTCIYWIIAICLGVTFYWDTVYLI